MYAIIRMIVRAVRATDLLVLTAAGEFSGDLRESGRVREGARRLGRDEVFRDSGGARLADADDVDAGILDAVTSGHVLGQRVKYTTNAKYDATG